MGGGRVNRERERERIVACSSSLRERKGERGRVREKNCYCCVFFAMVVRVRVFGCCLSSAGKFMSDTQRNATAAPG